jgi:hypothetical protein
MTETETNLAVWLLHVLIPIFQVNSLGDGGNHSEILSPTEMHLSASLWYPITLMARCKSQLRESKRSLMIDPMLIPKLQKGRLPFPCSEFLVHLHTQTAADTN